MADGGYRARAARSTVPGEQPTDTIRDRILDVAERLFAANGIDTVTLRDVTSGAGVNLAAVHYHIGSREELLRAILARRMTPLLDERVRRLGGRPGSGSVYVQLEHIVRAFIEPSMQYDCSTDNYLIHRLLLRLSDQPAAQPTDLFQRVLADTHAAFLEALAETLPQLDRGRLEYRFEFMLTLLTHGTVLRARLQDPSRPTRGIAASDKLVPELILTVIATFAAP